jgi:hypothetical protein
VVISVVISVVIRFCTEGPFDVSLFMRSGHPPVPVPAAVEDGAPPDSAPPDGAPTGNAVTVGRGRRLAAGLTTAAACSVVLFALLAADNPFRVTAGAFVAVPVEALLGAALVLMLSAQAPRSARVLAASGGAVLGLLTVGKLLDMGFFAVLARPFDPVLDRGLTGDAVDFLMASAGRLGAIAVIAAAALVAVGVLVLLTLSVLRLTRLVVRHDVTATWAVAVLAVVWTTCAAFGLQAVPGVPLAADSAAAVARDRAVQVRDGLRDQSTFAAQASFDAFRDTPGKQLLTGLRGKDVMVAFVESYGRDAVQNPELAPQVDAVLDAGSRRLSAAGFGSRSAFLTSPTAGGRSWLAHSTLLSGLWIDNQQRYRNLVATDRLTLNGAFRRAGWQTLGVMPGVTRAWPEGAFFGLDRIYDSRQMGYRGPFFSWAPMTDQYALAAYERYVHASPHRGPVMTEIPLVSSHAPWTPLPHLIDWKDVGDGSIFKAMAASGDSPELVWRDPTRVRTQYRLSIEYTLNTLISFVQTYGDDNLVLVFLGDHQPAPIVTGDDAGRDVPITIVAHDRAVLDRISGWGWQQGLRPGPQAPVWPMDAFRDRFLTAFGPQIRS